MTNRSLLTALAVALLLACSGVAFAAFSSSVGLSVSASAGNLKLEFTSFSLGGGPGYVALTGLAPALPASSVSFSLGPFAPGDSIVIYYTVTNLGTLPATSISNVGPTPINSEDNWFFIAGATGFPTSLAPGASFTSTFTVELLSGLTDSSQGYSATITYSITGSVSG